MSVTVIVPTYNRSYLLERTIPTYLQSQVSHLILVDDCSKDDTATVAEGLMRKFPGKITYVRNEVNSKQSFSKNRGKGLVRTEYAYFGDDDSFLMPGSIDAMLETMHELNADIVGAVAPYCRVGQSVEERFREYLSQEPNDDPGAYVDMKHLRVQCSDLRPTRPVALPVLPACILVRHKFFSEYSFDTRFNGNGYREETDFVLSCTRGGARAFIDGRAVQINLDPKTTTGGARSFSRIRYEWYSFANTYKFLQKHHTYFEEEIGVWYLAPLFSFMRGRCQSATRKFFL